MFYLDISPLKKYRNYRWLYTGQLISVFGSMITYVAIPYQMYEITKSTFHVGMLGIVQLIPLVISGFWGGAVADSFNRRKIVLMTDISSAIGNLLLILFTLSGSKEYFILYILAGIMAIFKGFERPALEAMIQQLFEKKDIPKVSTLQSLKTTSGMILGPALGGVLISSVGITWTYTIDLLSYAASLFCVLQLRDLKELKEKRKANIGAILDGFKYAWKRPDLMGTYVVDMASMTFAFPNPLFPALATMLGDPGKLGWFYSAPAVGAFIGSLTSSWTHKVRRHGKGITIAALLWCVGIFGFGFTNDFYLWLIFLGFAGWADMISGIFRGTMWNETIPEDYRGRLASVEMISYSSGPLLGNTFMGTLADKEGFHNALMIGGVMGGAMVLILGLGIRQFWKYSAERS
ncbi:MFS transporter [Peredibacter sp. HCB2-198]|uniref:MFS transporter n=1 Tax=Peredibacter sp. HCB2-198 TaxID=3383025 RepID=UPI0038B53105